MIGAIVVAADVGAALEFYRRAFQCRVLEQTHDEYGVLRGATLEGDGYRLVLSAEDEPHTTRSPRHSGWSSVSLILRVRDVDLAVSRFVAAGGWLRSGPKRRPWGARAALVEDPEGHRWMLEGPAR